MRTRRTYKAATPPSEAVTVKPIVQALAVSGTKRRKLESCARGNPRSKQKNKFTRLWDLNIPSELLQEILSRLGLKTNIYSSAVCKTWCEAAVSVRKSQPRPWVFYARNQHSAPGIEQIVADPFGSQTHKFNISESDFYRIIYSRDGWLLMRVKASSVFFFNPFTGNYIYLPERPSHCFSFCLAFSAPPTSTSCLVFSYFQAPSSFMRINTWKPGETAWTYHVFETQGPMRFWRSCVFSNGIFFCISNCGHLGVFDPSRATWNILQVKPCLSFPQLILSVPFLLIEHEGDIFLMHARTHFKNPLLFKLNLKSEVWEEKRDLGGLTVFATNAGSFARAGLLAEERNRIYLPDTSAFEQHGIGIYYYTLGDEKGSNLPTDSILRSLVVWVDPPHNNVIM